MAAEKTRSNLFFFFEYGPQLKFEPRLTVMLHGTIRNDDF